MAKIRLVLVVGIHFLFSYSVVASATDEGQPADFSALATMADSEGAAATVFPFKKWLEGHLSGYQMIHKLRAEWLEKNLCCFFKGKKEKAKNNYVKRGEQSTSLKGFLDREDDSNERLATHVGFYINNVVRTQAFNPADDSHLFDPICLCLQKYFPQALQDPIVTRVARRLAEAKIQEYIESFEKHTKVAETVCSKSAAKNEISACCPICWDETSKVEWMTQCGHFYCKGCVPKVGRNCHSCKKKIDNIFRAYLDPILEVSKMNF